MPRSRLRLILVLVAVALGVAVLPWIVLRIAETRLEKVAGPLREDRFARPKPGADDPGVLLEEAARRIEISEAEREFLSSVVRGGPAAISRTGERLSGLLEKNDKVFQQVAALPRGASHRTDDPLKVPPDLHPQLILARLLYVQGILALVDGDPAGSMTAVRALGRQAAILEGEPDALSQAMGLAAERFQLQISSLLIAFQVPEPGRLVLSNDLHRRWLDAMAFQVLRSRKAYEEILERDEKGLENAGLAGRAIVPFHRWVGPLVLAASYDGHRLAFESWDRDYAWIQERSAPPPPGKSSLEKMRRTQEAAHVGLAALYRAVAASRILIRACAEALPAWQRGTACGEIELDRSLEAVPGANGSCVLRTREGAEYVRLFVKPGVVSAPQECRLPAPPAD